MRLALFLPLLASAAPALASDPVVARIFSRPIAAAELPHARHGTWFAARSLITTAWKEAERRFVEQHGLEATDADFAALAAFQARVRQARREHYQREAARAEADLKSPWLAVPWLGEKLRADAEERRARYERLVEGQRHYAPPTGRNNPGWIEQAKANKALYEKYGGAVAISLTDEPYPMGARNALLREHERAGDIAILDEALRAEFWRLLELPAQRMAKPEEIDFTYFWLKPVPKKYADPGSAP